MSRRNLFLCFDAFGTLFRPRLPIAQQYGDTARSLGIKNITDDQVQGSFRAAFKSEAKRNPNFGKANGMNAEQWWTSIIHNTFQPLVGKDEELPSELAPRLIHRFWSSEGYELLPGALQLLRGLRDNLPQGVDRLVIGVISNSDPRVPDVLTSLDLRVSPFTYGSKPPAIELAASEPHDIDLTVMSYDVGHEKPDSRIFQAAEEMLRSLPAADDTDVDSWKRIYVGDEYDKDVVGARNAGWNVVLLAEDPTDLPADVDKLRSGSPDLLEYFRSSSPAVTVRDFHQLAARLGAASTTAKV